MESHPPAWELHPAWAMLVDPAQEALSWRRAACRESEGRAPSERAAGGLLKLLQAEGKLAVPPGSRGAVHAYLNSTSELSSAVRGYLVATREPFYAECPLRTQNYGGRGASQQLWWSGTAWRVTEPNIRTKKAYHAPAAAVGTTGKRHKVTNDHIQPADIPLLPAADGATDGVAAEAATLEALLESSSGFSTEDSDNSSPRTYDNCGTKSTDSGWSSSDDFSNSTKDESFPPHVTDAGVGAAGVEELEDIAEQDLNTLPVLPQLDDSVCPDDEINEINEILGVAQAPAVASGGEDESVTIDTDMRLAPPEILSSDAEMSVAARDHVEPKPQLLPSPRRASSLTMVQDNPDVDVRHLELGIQQAPRDLTVEELGELQPQPEPEPEPEPSAFSVGFWQYGASGDRSDNSHTSRSEPEAQLQPRGSASNTMMVKDDPDSDLQDLELGLGAASSGVAIEVRETDDDDDDDDVEEEEEAAAKKAEEEKDVAEQWQYDDPPRGWVAYGPAQQQALCAARASGQMQLALGSEKWRYSVDLATMTQTNLQTGKKRSVRVVRDAPVPSNEYDTDLATAIAASLADTTTPTDEIFFGADHTMGTANNLLSAVGSNSLAVGDGEYFRVEHRAVIRSRSTRDSEEVGVLEEGEIIQVLEQRRVDGVARVRFDRGWTSIESSRGVRLLTKVDFGAVASLADTTTPTDEGAFGADRIMDTTNNPLSAAGYTDGEKSIVVGHGQIAPTLADVQEQQSGNSSTSELETGSDGSSITRADADSQVLLQGQLRKLGGKKNDQWRTVNVRLSSSLSSSGGLSWSFGSALRDQASGSQKHLSPAQIVSVSPYADIGVYHAFEVVSTVKNGKVYKFAADSDEQCDAWIQGIDAVCIDARTKSVAASGAEAGIPQTTGGDHDSNSLAVGDRVTWDGEHQLIRRGSVGTIIEIRADGKRVVLFSKASRPIRPEKLTLATDLASGAAARIDTRTQSVAASGAEAGTPRSTGGDHDSNSLAVGDGEYFRVEHRAVIRSRSTRDSEEVGVLEEGEIIQVLEQRRVDGVARVRFDRGWTSIESSRGVRLLTKVDWWPADQQQQREGPCPPFVLCLIQSCLLIYGSFWLVFKLGAMSGDGEWVALAHLGAMGAFAIGGFSIMVACQNLTGLTDGYVWLLPCFRGCVRGGYKGFEGEYRGWEARGGAV